MYLKNENPYKNKSLIKIQISYDRCFRSVLKVLFGSCLFACLLTYFDLFEDKSETTKGSFCLTLFSSPSEISLLVVGRVNFTAVISLATRTMAPNPL